MRRCTLPAACWFTASPSSVCPRPSWPTRSAKLEAQGVEVMTNMVIGRVLTIDELFEMGYKAVFVGSGAGLPMFMNIPGESLKGVLLRQRISDPYQPDEGLHRGSRYPRHQVQGCGGGRRRQRGHGRRPLRQCVWARSTCTSSTAVVRPKCPPVWKRSAPRQGRGHRVQDPVQPRGDSGRRRWPRERHQVRAHGAGRAGRLRPPSSHAPLRAASLCWTWTPLSWPSAPAPTP